MKTFFVVVVGLMGSGICMANTDATTEDERRYLIKIVQDIHHLDELATKAANQADPDARVTLDYVALRRDLQEIKRALESHITKPSRSPRKIKTLELAGNK